MSTVHWRTPKGKVSDVHSTVRDNMQEMGPPCQQEANCCLFAFSFPRMWILPSSRELGGGGEIGMLVGGKLQRGRRREGKFVIIAYTNEELITQQPAAQTVLLEAECRGQHQWDVWRFGCWRDGPKSVAVKENQQLMAPYIVVCNSITLKPQKTGIFISDEPELRGPQH